MYYLIKWWEYVLKWIIMLYIDSSNQVFKRSGLSNRYINQSWRHIIWLSDDNWSGQVVQISSTSSDQAMQGWNQRSDQFTNQSNLDALLSKWLLLLLIKQFSWYGHIGHMFAWLHNLHYLLFDHLMLIICSFDNLLILSLDFEYTD